MKVGATKNNPKCEFFLELDSLELEKFRSSWCLSEKILLPFSVSPAGPNAYMKLSLPIIRNYSKAGSLLKDSLAELAANSSHLSRQPKTPARTRFAPSPTGFYILVHYGLHYIITC